MCPLDTAPTDVDISLLPPVPGYTLYSLQYLGMQLGGVLSTSQVAKSFMGTGVPGKRPWGWGWVVVVGDTQN